MAIAEPVTISSLEHLSYCPRQCAIIHVEQSFEDNVFTERGNLAHRKTDPGTGPEGRIKYGVRLWSDRLGLTGIADAVDFRPSGPYPIEYKVGRRRSWRHEEIQLCAQAMCLEEMFDCDVPEGAVFYRGSQARRTVALDRDLRRETEDVIMSVRRLLNSERLPPPARDERCPGCSLSMLCLPELGNRRLLAQLRSQLFL